MTESSAPVALITGGSRGIGLASASILAERGYRLMLASRNRDQLALAQTKLHQFSPQSEIHIYCLDVSDEFQVKDLFRQTQNHFKQLDVLINCAGIMPEAALSMTRSEDLQQVFATNVFGNYYCCQYAARLMSRNQRGSIINLASSVGEQGVSGQSAYAASKAAVSGLTRSLAKELGPQGIRVNAVAPGFIDTELTAHYESEKKDSVIAKSLLGRAGEAREVAELIAFLASKKSSYITGQVININGGLKL